MSKVEDLISQGIVSQDPNKEERVIFNVPIYIPKAAIELGGFEAFAKAYGWSPDPSGIPAHEKCVQVIWDFVREVFRAQMLTQAQEQARQQATEQINQLLGTN